MSIEPRAPRRHRRQPARPTIWRKFMQGVTDGIDAGLVRGARRASPGTVLNDGARADDHHRADVVDQLDHDVELDVDDRARTPTTSTSTRPPRARRPPCRRPARTSRRTEASARPGAAAGSVDGLVRVAGAAREAPALDVVDDLDLLLLVPRLGGQVDAVQGDDLDAVVPAAVTAPTSSTPRRLPTARLVRRSSHGVRCAHRRQPPGAGRDRRCSNAHEAHRARRPRPQGPRRAPTRS